MEPRSDASAQPQTECGACKVLSDGTVGTCPAHSPDAFLLRPANLEDPKELAFIESSWRRSYDYRPCPGGVQEYIATQGAVIDQALKTGEVLVACSAERAQQIFGWCCYRRPSVVHFVFVKPYYRRMGLGQAMLLKALAAQPGAIYASHDWENAPHKRDGIRTMVAAARRAGVQVIYNPALIFGGTTT